MSLVLSATGPKKCIICLQHASTMVPLSTEVDIDGVAMNCGTMYGRFTGIQYEIARLAKERLLHLCLACLTQLSTCYLFQRKAIESADSIFASAIKIQEHPIVEKLTVEYLDVANEELKDHTSNYVEEDDVIEDTNLDHNSAYASDEEVPSSDEIKDLKEANVCTGDEELLSFEPDTPEDNVQPHNEQTVPETSKPSCNECTRLAGNVTFFRKHFVKSHCLKTAGDRYQCTVCLGNFKFLRSFIRHTRTHQGSKRYACQFCPKSFHYSHHLQAHERMHTKEKPYACSKCSKAFVSRERLGAHEETHGTEHRFECELCSARFKTRQNLNKHNLTQHDRPVAKFRSFKCDQCGKVMLSQSAVTYHKQHPCVTHRQVNSEQRTTKIVQHINPTNRKYHCDVCGTQFNQTIELKRHKLIHEGTRPFKCEVCNCTFRQKGTLTTHMRTHTDEKPYECYHCPARFRSAGSRRSHYMRQHANDDTAT
uniref:C2H2-type domain-containing protein n=1 Tax=Anopheles minimus TaxID=112268 RepID=A0A182VYF6_9DIPT